jgi:hypothetical protein
MASRLSAFGTVTLVLGAWTALAASLAFAMPPGRSLAIMGPSARSLRAVAVAGGSILRADGLIVVARSNDPQFVRRLYAAGAILVLDAEDSGGCSGRRAARGSPGATTGL